MAKRALLALFSLTSLAMPACDRDASSSGAPKPGASSTAAAAQSGCPALMDHWRDVWKEAAPQGFDRRSAYVIRRVNAAWSDACTSIAKEPSQDLTPALDELRAARTFADIETIARSGGSPTKAALAKALDDAAAKTKSAYAAPASGVDDCEEAFANAAFCGDDVDKASVKSAAGDKNDSACASLTVLLEKKCSR